MHIGIAGNIGSGKTTLTSMLAEHYGWTPKFEAVTYNPYLEDYYKDIPRWSYNLETYFLAQRFKDVLEIAGSNDTVIQDRTIFEGVYIFVANNKALGNLSERDYNTFMELFNLMISKCVKMVGFSYRIQEERKCCLHGRRRKVSRFFILFCKKKFHGV